MMVNIDQRLLHDAEERRLHLLRLALEGLRQIEVDPDAASLREARGVPP